MPELIVPRTDTPYTEYTPDEWSAVLANDDLLRDMAIGGSTVGAVMGMSDYTSPQDVWRRIMRVDATHVAVDSPAMRRGRALEPIVADIYEAETRRALYRAPTTYGAGRRALEPWMRFSPDRLIAAPSTDVTGGGRRQGRGVLEIKVLGRRTFDQTLAEGIDINYYAQLQWYLFGLNRSWGAFAVFNADYWRLHTFDVERDDDFIREMLARVHRFWYDHVIVRVEPGPQPPGRSRNLAMASEAATTRQRGADREYVTLTTATATEVFGALREALRLRRQAERMYTAAQEGVKQLMHDTGHERVRCTGLRCSFTESTRRHFDVARLREDRPVVITADELRRCVYEFAGVDQRAAQAQTVTTSTGLWVDAITNEANALYERLAAAMRPLDVDRYYRTVAGTTFRITIEDGDDGQEGLVNALETAAGVDNADA